jgi:hypothetical protein
LADLFFILELRVLLTPGRNKNGIREYPVRKT